MSWVHEVQYQSDSAQATGERLASLIMSRRDGTLDDEGEAALGEARAALRAGPQLQTGEILGLRYRLLQRLGNGALAGTWKAEDAETGALVAVKVLHSQFTHMAELRARFAEAAAHPAGAHGTEPAEDAGFVYWVRPFLEGPTLADVLSEYGRLHALQAVLDGMESLREAHEQGIVHANLKPENVILAGGGSGWLTDAGLNVPDAFNSLYSAPESAEPGSEATPAWDVYGFGMLLLFVMHGGPLPMWVLRAPEHLIDKLDVAAGVRMAIAAAIRWEPSERIAPVGDLLDTLLAQDPLVAQLADAAFEAGRTHVAVRHAQTLADRSGTAAAHLRLARTLAANGRTVEASAAALRALEDPSAGSEGFNEAVSLLREFSETTGQWQPLVDALEHGVDAGELERDVCRLEVARLHRTHSADLDLQAQAWELVLHDHSTRAQAREAIEALAELMIARENWPEAVAQLTHLVEYVGDREAADLAYRIGRMVEERLPGDPQALHWLGEALDSGYTGDPDLADRLARIRSERGEWDAVRQMARAQAESADPSIANAALRRAAGISQYGDRHLDEAERLYVEALVHNPNDAVALRQLARLHLAAGDGPEAIALFRRGTQLQSDDDRTPGSLARDNASFIELLLEAGEINEATEVLTQALDREPDHLDLLCLRGQIAWDAGELAAAHAAFADLERLAPRASAALRTAQLKLGQIAWLQGDALAASRHAWSVLEDAPDDRDGWWMVTKAAIAATPAAAEEAPWLRAAPACFTAHELVARLLSGLVVPEALTAWLELDPLGRACAAAVHDRCGLEQAAAVVDLTARRGLVPALLDAVAAASPERAADATAAAAMWAREKGAPVPPLSVIYGWTRPDPGQLAFDAGLPRKALPGGTSAPVSAAGETALSGDTGWSTLLQIDPEASTHGQADGPGAVVPGTRPSPLPLRWVLVSDPEAPHRGEHIVPLPVSVGGGPDDDVRIDGLAPGRFDLLHIGGHVYLAARSPVIVEQIPRAEVRLLGGETLVVDDRTFEFHPLGADLPAPQPTLEPKHAPEPEEGAPPEPGPEPELKLELEADPEPELELELEADPEPALALEAEPELEREPEEERAPDPVRESAEPIPMLGDDEELDLEPPALQRAALVCRIGSEQLLIPLVTDSVDVVPPGDELEVPPTCRIVNRDNQFVLERLTTGELYLLQPDESFDVAGVQYTLKMLDDLDEPAAPEPGRRQTSPHKEDAEEVPALVIDDGSPFGWPVPLNASRFTVGRGRDNDLKLGADGRLSRRHFTLEQVASGEWLLQDGGSSNGTFVNDELVSERMLKPGDVIKIGMYTMQFRYGDFAADGEGARSDPDFDDSEMTEVFPPGGVETLPVSIGEGTERIRVANAALKPLIQALDQREGVGSGQAQLQRIMWRAPDPFSSLFQGLEARATGVPEMPVLFNVALHPPADQRPLLNGALSDLIERTISLAYDTFDDGELQHLLTQVAAVNYRERLRP